MVIIPKIILMNTDSDFLFGLKIFQFPIRVPFAMTIDKSQGQTFEKVGIYLYDPCFTHGELYVTLSRCNSKNGIKVVIPNTVSHQNNDTTQTKNPVYKEVLILPPSN